MSIGSKFDIKTNTLVASNSLLSPESIRALRNDRLCWTSTLYMASLGCSFHISSFSGNRACVAALAAAADLTLDTPLAVSTCMHFKSW